MSNIAVEMSHNEATALAHAVTQAWRGLEKPPGKTIASDAAAAITALQQAKANVDNAVAAAQNELDGGAALKATSQALADYKAFTAACDAAMPTYVAARRNDFSVMATAARNISDKIVALSRVKKPWLLASRARKNAYQTLSDNATEAQSLIAQLDGLNLRAGTASSLGKMDVVLGRAAAIKANLSRLLESSNAAFIISNQ